MSARPLGTPWRQADPLLLTTTLALAGLGTILVISATWHYTEPPSVAQNPWLLKQVAFLFLGLAALMFCATTRAAALRNLAFVIYGVSLVFLLMVAVAGKGGLDNGADAQRWLEIGGIQLQPSEPSKLALILALARVFSGRPPGLQTVLLSAVTAAVPIVLVYIQPNLGTALSMLAIWFGMLVLSGTPKRYVAAISLLTLMALPVLWLSMHDYMRQRIVTFLDPQAYALTDGYNLLQAQISIGSGGLWGKGLLAGTQTQLRYLRLSHSDFIFSVLGEELGFVGAMLLLVLFTVLLFRVFRAYDMAQGRFAALIAAGVASLIAFQVVANIGGNVGINPLAGIPLPFLSYGGSALVTQLAGIGLVQATLLSRRLYRFEV